MASANKLLVEHPMTGVTALWLNRPERKNAFDEELTAALHQQIADNADDVILVGTTDPSCFCAGADLGLADAARAELSDELYRLYEVMLSANGPIIAAVQGAAVAGGALFALAADLRVGERSTWFRFNGIKHGVATGAWGLPSLVGRGRALDLCLTMRSVEAEEGFRIGLLNRLEDDARTAALALAQQLADLDVATRGRLKRIATSAGVQEALQLERATNRESWTGAVASSPGSSPGKRNGGDSR